MEYVWSYVLPGLATVKLRLTSSTSDTVSGVEGDRVLRLDAAHVAFMHDARRNQVVATPRVDKPRRNNRSIRLDHRTGGNDALRCTSATTGSQGRNCRAGLCVSTDVKFFDTVEELLVRSLIATLAPFIVVIATQHRRVLIYLFIGF